MPASQEIINEILDLARRKSWSNLDKAWAEMAVDPVLDPRFYTQWCQLLAKLRHPGPLEEMVRQVATSLNDAGKSLEATRILRAVLRMIPQMEGLREVLLTALVGAYGEREGFNECLAASQLESAPSLGKALLVFEVMLTSTPGCCLRHKAWGVGVVKEQDLENKTILIDFPDKPGQTISFSGIKEFLERIPSSHIQAKMATDPDGLRESLRNDPAENVKLALKNHGGEMKQGDLKALFVPLLFTPAQWTRWWTSAKDALRMDPMVDVQGTGAHCRLSLRAEARSVVDDVLHRFEEAQTHHARLQAVREAGRFVKSKGLSNEDLKPISNFLQRGAENAADGSDRLTWSMLAAELAESADPEVDIWRPDLGALIQEPGADAELVRGLDLGEHQSRAMQIVLEQNRRQFAEMCVGLIDEVSLTQTKWMMNTLLETDENLDLANDALSQLLHEPQAHPDGYIWALESVIEGPLGKLPAAQNHVDILERVFKFLETAQHLIDTEDPDAGRLRTVAGKFRNALEADRHEVLAWVFQNLNAEQAKALFARMQGLTALSDAWKNEASASIKAFRSDLEDHGPIEQSEDILMVTEASLKAKTSELQDIRTRQIPENSNEIEVAREHGDLKENAEYKAAKERQVILHRRSEELQIQLDKARAIDPALIDIAHVSPGTKVRLLNKGTNQEDEYTLLGLWDANPDVGIISYKSPLGSQLLRRELNEEVTVTLPSGETIDYKVLSIDKAL